MNRACQCDFPMIEPCRHLHCGSAGRRYEVLCRQGIPNVILKDLNRRALHVKTLSLIHPVSLGLKRLHFTFALPQDLWRFLGALEGFSRTNRGLLCQ